MEQQRLDTNQLGTVNAHLEQQMQPLQHEPHEPQEPQEQPEQTNQQQEKHGQQQQHEQSTQVTQKGFDCQVYLVAAGSDRLPNDEEYSQNCKRKHNCSSMQHLTCYSKWL